MRVYRKLVPFEYPRLERHLLRLDAEDRARRFSGSVGDAAVTAHCRRLDWLRAVVVGCFDDGALRGAAELWLDPSPAGRAELAITVERPWQGHGIGSALLGRALLVAGNRSARSLSMLCLLDNRRMQHLARKFGGRLVLAADQAEADLVVPYPTQLSLWEEAAGEGLGFVGSWVEQFSLAPWAVGAWGGSGTRAPRI